MNEQPVIVIQIGRRALALAVLAIALVSVLVLAPTSLRAQKVQENYKEKFDVTKDSSGVAIATSADGTYVYVVGTNGILVSDDHGKTGSWVQTVRLK